MSRSNKYLLSCLLASATIPHIAASQLDAPILDIPTHSGNTSVTLTLKEPALSADEDRQSQNVKSIETMVGYGPALLAGTVVDIPPGMQGNVHLKGEISFTGNTLDKLKEWAKTASKSEENIDSKSWASTSADAQASAGLLSFMFKASGNVRHENGRSMFQVNNSTSEEDKGKVNQFVSAMKAEKSTLTSDINLQINGRAGRISLMSYAKILRIKVTRNDNTETITSILSTSQNPDGTTSVEHQSGDTEGQSIGIKEVSGSMNLIPLN